MAAIGKVETFVADRKVGNAGTAYRKCQRRPVVQRRVVYLVLPELPVAAGNPDMAHFAAPPFDQRKSKRIALQRHPVIGQACNAHPPIERIEQCPHIPGRLRHFARIRTSAVIYIAGILRHRIVRNQFAVRTTGMGLPDIPYQTGSPGRHADSPDTQCLRAGDHAAILKTGQNRRGSFKLCTTPA